MGIDPVYGEQLALFPLPAEALAAMTTERRNALRAQERYRHNEGLRGGLCAVPGCSHYASGRPGFPHICAMHGDPLHRSEKRCAVKGCLGKASSIRFPSLCLFHANDPERRRR